MPVTKKPAAKPAAKKTVAAKPAAKKTATAKPEAKKSSTAKPSAKKTSTVKPVVKKLTAKETTKPAARTATKSSSSGAGKPEDIIAIIKLLISMLQSDGKVSKKEIAFIQKTLTGFGITDKIMQVQLIEHAQKMSVESCIKHVKKLDISVKNSVSYFLLQSTVADGKATIEEAQLYLKLCEVCNLPNLFNK